MDKLKLTGGLDLFKIIAAMLVVAIHTSPLSSLNDTSNFIFSNIISRIAVPFFFMVTGYFVLADIYTDSTRNKYRIQKYIKKLLVLYFIAIIIYLPVNIYAGHFSGVGMYDIFRMLIFDGTFYHLWYIPAVIAGVLIVCFLSKKLSLKALVMISLFLYCIGLFGDSYYGLTLKNPIASFIYNIFFKFFSYTRNGIFYAPIFLVMGISAHSKTNNSSKTINIIGFLMSVALMIAEGLTLQLFKVQRHYSMLVFLLPCMFFLFQIALSLNIEPQKQQRTISTIIYIIHPLVIIVVRGAAKILNIDKLFIENSLIHFITVCIVSYIFSLLIILLGVYRNKHKRVFQKGRAWIEIDTNNLRHNVEKLQKILPEKCSLMPVLKANAYGHGAVLIANALNNIGIYHFCVATVSEGIELRKSGIKGEILVLGYTHPKQLFLLRRYDLTQTVIDCNYAAQLSDFGKKIKVHIKIDTGMHRLGERSEKINDICSIFLYDNLIINGIFTHLCVSDSIKDTDEIYTKLQIEAFDEVVSHIKKGNFHCPPKHLQASYGIINYPELQADYARAGIAIYGMLSNRPTDSNIDLHPVLSIKARIISVKELIKGEATGYGLQYVAEQNIKIAIISIGYADGLPRSLSSGNGKVLIDGIEAPIIGRICMDLTLVDISNIPNVIAGDIATIIGKSGNSEITVYDLAEASNTITNEILSRLGARLERVIDIKGGLSCE